MKDAAESEGCEVMFVCLLVIATLAMLGYGFYRLVDGWKTKTTEIKALEQRIEKLEKERKSE